MSLCTNIQHMAVPMWQLDTVAMPTSFLKKLSWRSRVYAGHGGHRGGAAKLS